MIAYKMRLGGIVMGQPSIVDEDENVALAAKGKKGKSKKGASTSGSKGQGKPKKKGEKDMSKVRCWACQKMGHYAVTCPERKRGKVKNVAASTEIEEFSSRFDQEFSLVVGLATSVTSSTMWYIDSGASRHMTGVREQFSDLAERALDIDIVLGDDRKVKAAGVGTVSFERESLPPLRLTEVLYVPGLKKSLVSVSTIEDRGFEVVFRNGQVLMYPKGGNITSVKVIGVVRVSCTGWCLSQQGHCHV
jgi:hypothetical protein